MVDTTDTLAGPGNVPIARLRATITGQVLTPGDPAYDEARNVYQGTMKQRPAVVVRPADARDVARVIEVARETGVPLAVKSGGHSVFCLCDDGIVLDLSSLRELSIDVESRTAWTGPGVTAGQFTNAAAEHGLATGFGDTGSVGVGGITLGGGIGYLVRKYGMTIDDLIAAEIVTADGEVRRIDAENEPDLFWAIRGGGGNFGVVTRLQLRLHELPSVLGGMLVFPATPEIVTGFVELSEQAPEELSSIVNVMPAPPMPFLPAEYYGKPVFMAMMVYAGGGEAAERAIAPFRALGTPIVDMVAPMSYAGVYPPDQEMHPIAASRTLFVDAIDSDTATTLLDAIGSSTAVLPAVQIRVLGGAMRRVPADATAFALRDRAIMLNLAAIYEKLDEADVHEEWVSNLLTKLQNGVTGAYVGFLAHDGEARIHEAYPEPTWSRLRAVKAKYDPTNLFRINNNIPPAA